MGLDAVELVVEIEKAFKISIPNDAAAAIITAEDFYNVVEKYVEGRGYYTRADIEKTIKYIIAEFTGIPLDKITPVKHVCEDLGLD